MASRSTAVMPTPWKRPFQVDGSQTSMWIGLPAESVWVSVTSQKAGSPVSVGCPGEAKLPLVLFHKTVVPPRTGTLAAGSSPTTTAQETGIHGARDIIADGQQAA
jgi:hypothetical protein